MCVENMPNIKNSLAEFTAKENEHVLSASQESAHASVRIMSRPR